MKIITATLFIYEGGSGHHHHHRSHHYHNRHLVDMTVVGASPGQTQSLGQQELALWMGVHPRSTWLR